MAIFWLYFFVVWGPDSVSLMLRSHDGWGFLIGFLRFASLGSGIVILLLVAKRNFGSNRYSGLWTWLLVLMGNLLPTSGMFAAFAIALEH